MKIELNKEYLTRDGSRARVICVDMKHKTNKIVALIFRKYGEEIVLTYEIDGTTTYPDLKLVSEYSPSWDDVAVDTPVLVWGDEDGIRHRRYFSHYRRGIIYTFLDGKTSWSNTKTDRQSWKYGDIK